jgi:hypothetical protein
MGALEFDTGPSAVGRRIEEHVAGPLGRRMKQ